MRIEPLEIEGLMLVTPKRHGDARGWFAETWRRDLFAQAGLDVAFVQDNESLSAEPGTLRGLHFQTPPFAQVKLIRVVRGRILDVAVDIRRGSPSYGRHVAVELSSGEGRQLFVPTGFAHGFVTLEPDTHVAYKVDAPYAPDHDHGLAFDDPALGIAWPFPAERLLTSDKDRRHPRLADLPAYFP